MDIIAVFPDRFEVYYKKNGQVEKIPFDSYVQYQEILNREGLLQSLNNYFSQKKITSVHPFVVYSSSVTYISEVTSEISLVSREDFEKNTNAVPLKNNLKDFLIIEENNKKFILTINKEYFNIISEALKKIKSSISGIYCFNQFSELKNKNNILLDDYIMLSNWQKKNKKRSFPLCEVSTGRSFSIPKIHLKQIIGISIALFLFTLSIIFAWRNIASQKKQIEAQIKKQPIIEKPTPTPTIIYKTKDELIIKILNGTGTAGQAGKVKDLLNDNEFPDVVTDNSEDTNTVTANAIFDRGVAETDKTEIINLLKTLFESVNSEEKTSSDSFDVTIITGQEK